MTTLKPLIARNTRLFFREKGLFLTALITPVILLVLYITFLGNIYKDAIVAITDGLGYSLSGGLLNGFVGGQLIASILSVSCITVSVTCNMLMVQDKATGAHKDIMISPVSPSVLALSYYISTLISTLIICFTALAASLLYLAIAGFYLTLLDVLLVALDIVILVCFGTAFSSVIGFFLSTQGQISAVGSVISSCYGFICAAYTPLSQFGEGMRNVLGVLPGTYGTSLLRRHTLRGVTEKMSEAGMSDDAIRAIRDSADYHIYLGGTEIPVSIMYAVLLGCIAALILAYVLMNAYRIKHSARK